MFQEEKRNSATLIGAAVVLIVIAAAGVFWFFKKNDHPVIEAAITQSEVMPLHVQYAHVYGNAGRDQSEDATYVIARIRIDNRNDAAPLFLKDITAHLQPRGYAPITSGALEKDDLTAVLKAFPKLQADAQKLGGKPLLREIEIAHNASAEGYAVFQFKCQQKIWDERQAAKIDLDFYHNQTTTATFPK